MRTRLRGQLGVVLGPRLRATFVIVVVVVSFFFLRGNSCLDLVLFLIILIRLFFMAKIVNYGT